MKRKKHSRSKPKSRKSFFLRHWQIFLVAFAFISVGVASAALITPKTPQPHTTAYDENVAVYRPADKAWVDIALEDLQPLDFLLKDGNAYHVKAPYTTSSGRVQTVPLGQASRAELERHLDNYDPEDKLFPQSDIELVYAKWEGTDLWTFQPLGKLTDGDLFQHNGREFVTRVSLDGSRGVKPTGNVLSKVNGVWSEHHDNQIHLTLFFPEIGETNKIITTHEHPFYVPTTKTWVPAADLKVGMDLQTCDGTPVRVADWVLVDEPFTAWNIEVANSHTYYVADPNNPNAPPVLVHNDCFTKIEFKGLVQNRPLKELTDTDIEKAFDGTGYTLSSHIRAQLRDNRLTNLGFNNLNDVRQIINKGEFFDAGDGAVGKIYRGVSVIMDPQTKNIITVRPGRRGG